MICPNSNSNDSNEIVGDKTSNWLDENISNTQWEHQIVNRYLDHRPNNKQNFGK